MVIRVSGLRGLYADRGYCLVRVLRKDTKFLHVTNANVNFNARKKYSIYPRLSFGRLL